MNHARLKRLEQARKQCPAADPVTPRRELPVDFPNRAAWMLFASLVARCPGAAQAFVRGRPVSGEPVEQAETRFRQATADALNQLAEAGLVAR